MIRIGRPPDPIHRPLLVLPSQERHLGKRADECASQGRLSVRDGDCGRESPVQMDTPRYRMGEFPDQVKLYTNLVRKSVDALHVGDCIHPSCVCGAGIRVVRPRCGSGIGILPPRSELSATGGIGPGDYE